MAQSLHTPAAERRRLEQENLKASRINHIIECSFELFAENGIESISLNEIAEKSEIGVASLYRYFSTKDDLAIEVAVWAWNQENNLFKQIYESESYNRMNGFNQISLLMEIFPTALVEQTSFFRFIYYFDSFVKREKISSERLAKYEQTIDMLNQIVIKALEKGRMDSSINTKKNPEALITSSSDEDIYFTFMHTIFSLAQKLALSGEMLFMDKKVQSVKQLELLIDIMLNTIKA